MTATLGIRDKLNKHDAASETCKLSDNLEDAKIEARRLAKRARYAADDLVRDVEHGIRHNPWPSLAMAFGAGALIGMVLFASFKTKK